MVKFSTGSSNHAILPLYRSSKSRLHEFDFGFTLSVR